MRKQRFLKHSIVIKHLRRGKAMSERRFWEKGIVVGISLIVVGASGISCSAHNPIGPPFLRFEGDWFYVGGTGPENYTKIQDAIDNASDGDGVYVYNGIYPEHIQIQQNITLMGENKNDTIVDGQQSNYDIVTILRCTVRVTGLSMRNNSLNHSCIAVKNSLRCSLEGNVFYTMSGNAVQIHDSGFIEIKHNLVYTIITDDPVPLFALHSSHNCTLTHNIIEETKQTRGTAIDGIVADDCKDLHISSNTISTVQHGITVFGESIEIANNTVTDCSIGIAIRTPLNSALNSKNIIIKDNVLLGNSRSNIYLQAVTQAIISGNDIQDSLEYGIYIEDTFFTNPEQINITDNSIVTNRCGIEIKGASHVLIEQNQIHQNDVGISIEYCKFSYVQMNTFLGNGHSATFKWFWFFSFIDEICDKIPRFSNNFWDKKRTTPQPIIGRWHLWSPIFPHVNFLFWMTFDWHPANAPYSILRGHHDPFL